MLNTTLEKRSIYHDDYVEADKWVGINEDDSVLKPIYLKLPSPPDIRYIDGYGKHPLDQKWERIEYPDRLKRLEEKAYMQLEDEYIRSKHETVTGFKIQERFWKLLTDQSQHYKEEIKYIKRIQYYMLYGRWIFIKGKPTWIPPWHFCFLQFGYMPENKNKYPDYRDVDRRSEVFKWYEYTTHETFSEIDANGNPKMNELGEYEMIEMANRTCFGDQEAKRRRQGKTTREVIKMLWIIITGKAKLCTITSFTPEEAKTKIYDPILIPIWQQLELPFKPINALSNKPESGIILSPPRNKFNIDSLDSKLLLAENSKLTANDGGKLFGGLFDEQGKITIVDTKKRWGVNKKTMAQGADIRGYASHPSTVEEMEEGGQVYYRMWKQSDFYVRKPNGQTISGLFREFKKAWDGYDGFIDPWGYSVIETPTEEQLKYAPLDATYRSKKIGAKQYILENRKALLRSNDPDAQDEYAEEIRKEPIDSTECFLGSMGSIGFDIKILSDRLKEIEGMEKEPFDRGNLEWVNGIKFGDVYWQHDPNGKFLKSVHYNGNETNRRLPGEAYSVIQQGLIPAWRPEFPNRGVIGVDPVEYSNKSEAKMMDSRVRKSDFAIVYKIRKLPTDTSQDKREWEGDRIGFSYRNMSENIDELCEDVLKLAIWTESLIFLERNKGTQLWRNIVEWGFGGYLGYSISPDGKINETPGTYIQGANKNEGFELIRSHIKYRGHMERHPDVLRELMQIPGPEMMKKYDLVAAYMQCELGERSGYSDYMNQANIEDSIDISELNEYIENQNYFS